MSKNKGDFIIPKMDPKQLTDDNLWDGYWLEEKYPHKFKKNKQWQQKVNKQLEMEENPYNGNVKGKVILKHGR